MGIFAEQGFAQQIMEDYNWPDTAGFAHLATVTNIGVCIFFSLLFVALAAFGLRRLIRRTRSVRITYENGPEIVADRGLTLLEMSQMKGIPTLPFAAAKGVARHVG